jgi:hypothetical protein
MRIRTNRTALLPEPVLVGQDSILRRASNPPAPEQNRARQQAEAPARHRSGRAPLIGLVLASALAAQSIRGTVGDPDGAPIAGAMVQALGSCKRVSPDEQGRFVLDPAAPGSAHAARHFQELRTHPGGCPGSQSGSIDVTIEFSRIRAAVTSIEVLGESTEAVLEKPGSVFQIDRQELRDSHPMDANEVLRRVPAW